MRFWFNLFLLKILYKAITMGERYTHELCRLCLYKSETLFDIFDVNGRHGYLAAVVIEDLLQIEVDHSDGFPRCVCSICLDKLTDFKLFKDQCLESRSSFEQEFGPAVSLALHGKCGSLEVDQDPLVCSSSIKTEVKPEVEIVEIPTEDEEDIKMGVRASPVSSEHSDLDVVTVDDDNNILCLGSKEEMEFRVSHIERRALSTPEGKKRHSSDRAGSTYRQRGENGRFVKVQKRRRKKGGEQEAREKFSDEHASKANAREAMNTTLEQNPLLMELLSRPQSPVISGNNLVSSLLLTPEGKEGTQPTTAEHPLWCDGMENNGTQDSGEKEMEEENSRWQFMQRKKRQSIVQGRAGQSSTAHARTQGNVTPKVNLNVEEKSKSTAQVQVLACNNHIPDPVSSETLLQVQLPELHDVRRKRRSEMAVVEPIVAPTRNRTNDETNERPAVQHSAKSAEQHPLFIANKPKPSEPQWKQPKRVAASAQMYNEDSILLSSGNTPQGFVEWGCLGSEMKKRRRRRKKVPSPKGTSHLTQEAVQGTTDDAIKANVLGTAQGAVVGGKKQFQCFTCGKIFPSRSKYHLHRKSHSQGLRRGGGYACPLCSREFSSMPSMKRHHLLHSGLRPFGCNLCDVAYTRLDLLKRHMDTHRGPGAATPLKGASLAATPASV